MTIEAKKQILVVDLPSGTTRERAESLLNGAYEQGYYLRTILPGDDGVWAYLSKRATEGLKPDDKAKSNRDIEHARAVEIIKMAPGGVNPPIANAPIPIRNHTRQELGV